MGVNQQSALTKTQQIEDARHLARRDRVGRGGQSVCGRTGGADVAFGSAQCRCRDAGGRGDAAAGADDQLAGGDQGAQSLLRKHTKQKF